MPDIEHLLVSVSQCGLLGNSLYWRGKFGLVVCAGTSLGSIPSMLPMMDTSEVDHLLGLQRRLYGEVSPP